MVCRISLLFYDMPCILNHMPYAVYFTPECIMYHIPTLVFMWPFGPLSRVGLGAGSWMTHLAGRHRGPGEAEEEPLLHRGAQGTQHPGHGPAIPGGPE